MDAFFLVRLKVLRVASFKDHKYVQVETPAMYAKGFSIGARVAITKRVSAWFATTGKFHDVCVDDIAWVMGEADGVPVVRVQKPVPGKPTETMEADAKIKIEKLQ